MLNESLETLQDYETKIASSKVDIAAAIVAKGGTVNTGDGLMDFAADIATITNQFGVPTEITWTGLTNFDGRYVWTDGIDIYYSYGSSQYILDKTTSTWIAKTWNGLTSFNASLIWNDGENVYYSDSSTAQKVLDKNTSTWNDKTWNGFATPYGTYIWTDGENIYHSGGNSSTQYILNKNTSTWNSKTWTGLTSFQGYQIWTDGENIYRAGGTSSDHYKLDKNTSKWTKITFSGSPTNPDANYIWHAGGNTYYSHVTSNPSYFCSIFDKNTLTWTNLGILRGDHVWHDGENVYYSYNGINTIIK